MVYETQQYLCIMDVRVLVGQQVASSLVQPDRVLYFILYADLITD